MDLVTTADVRTYTTTETRDGVSYSAMLTVSAGHCTEVVFNANMEVIHEADFPASNISGADRDEYTRVMLSSVLDARRRALTRAGNNEPS